MRMKIPLLSVSTAKLSHTNKIQYVNNLQKLQEKLYFKTSKCYKYETDAEAYAYLLQVTFLTYKQLP